MKFDGKQTGQRASARNTRVALLCATFAVGMGGLAYAAVPLYQMFCQVTGFAGTPQRAEQASKTMIERRISVRFDANVGPGLSWDVLPVVSTMDMRVGENGLAFYRVTNRSDRTVVGTASFNVTPDQAGPFFNKVECFCFTEQWLDPGETAELPVSFFVDPAIEKDLDGAAIRNITLSYTFHPVDKPKARSVGEKAGADKRG